MKAATWNLLHGLDVRTGRIDLGGVATAVDRMDVDVLAVQEVDRELSRTGHADQVAELAAKLGWHHLFAPALLGDPSRRWDEGPGSGPDPGGPAYGVGLLSRHPLRELRRHPLPGGGPGERQQEDVGRALPGPDHEPRILLAARTGPPGSELVVATAHLSYLPWRAAAQLREALGVVDALGTPALLMGDLNLPLRGLRFALLGTGWSCGTATATYPSWRPGMQLDHVLVRGALLHEVTAGLRGPSDHLPVRAHVTWH